MRTRWRWLAVVSYAAGMAAEYGILTGPLWLSAVAAVAFVLITATITGKEN